MYVQRNKNQPMKPATIDDVVIARPYTRTTEDDIFLLADVQQNSERVIIFSSPIQLEILAQADRWHMDGTFK